MSGDTTRVAAPAPSYALPRGTIANGYCFDSISGDPLAGHIQRHQWCGLFVEPNAASFERLRNNPTWAIRGWF